MALQPENLKGNGCKTLKKEKKGSGESTKDESKQNKN